MTDTRKELSKILIKWHMPTNQAALNEMVALINQSNREYADTLIGGDEIYERGNRMDKAITLSRNYLRAELRKKNATPMEDKG
jgi:hypothetical protein